jgi:hypothetical protein
MSVDLSAAYLTSADKACLKLKQFGSGLRPVDAPNGWFFQIVFELIDATLSNYDYLKVGYNQKNSHMLAWACRNLLELAVFTKFVLMCEGNARRFAQDRLIDGCDIIKSLKALELYIDSKSNTGLLDDALSRMQAQMTAEGVTDTKYLSINVLAQNVGMKEEYLCMNRVCSKLVHPTAWSILAVNKGEDAFSQSRPILFQAGVRYLCDLYLEIEQHNATHGMKPKP